MFHFFFLMMLLLQLKDTLTSLLAASDKRYTKLIDRKEEFSRSLKKQTQLS